MEGSRVMRIVDLFHNLLDESISGDEICLHWKEFFIISNRCNMFSIKFQQYPSLLR